MFYNLHIHTFCDCDVPRRFLPLGLVRVLSTKPGFAVLSRLMNSLNPFSDNDALDRYVKFVKLGKLGSQQRIFEECARFYPEETRFAILPMDMAYMGAGPVPRPYGGQISELAQLYKTYPLQVIPFFHVDPRRPAVSDMFKRSVERGETFGMKIYPPLGYFPYDEILLPLYEFCAANNLPVISHYSPYNPVHFKGSKDELRSLLSKSKEPLETKGKNRKELCAHFTNPKNWEYVLKQFPGLKVCLAHFGSAYYWKKHIENPGEPGNWFAEIKDMLRQYPNLFTDISFTMSERDYFPLLKVLLSDEDLRKKILFGSDYYMVETEATERRFGLDLRAFLGEELWNQIAVINPERFLKGKIV